MSKVRMGRGGRAIAARPPDLLAWSRRFLPDYFTDEPAPFHAELMRDLADAGNRLIARVAPRGHAKSTCAALAYPLWRLCESRIGNVVIITNASSLARQFLRDIRAELETNPLLREAYGDRLAVAPTTLSAPRPRATSTRLTTNTGFTIQAKGSGQSLRGVKVGPHRPDLIICDDLEKDENVATVEQRDKLEHWLRRVVMPALAPEGRLVVLGSIIHYDSLLARLADRRRFPGWDYRVYRALEAQNDECRRKNAEPEGPRDQGGEGQRGGGAEAYTLRALWPARWPVERLYEERERIGTLAFEQEYMANPLDETLRVFRPEWLKRCDEAEVRRLAAEGYELIPLIAVDPATGKDGGDFFALWAGGLEPRTGVLYTRRLTCERIGIVEQVQRVVAAFEEYRPIRVAIETTAYQAALKQILEEESRRRGLFMPIVELRTTINKRARIEGLAPFFEKGLVRLPAALDPEIEAQFLHFPKAKHDDGPDVCAMAVEVARGLRSVSPEGQSLGRLRFARRGGW